MLKTPYDQAESGYDCTQAPPTASFYTYSLRMRCGMSLERYGNEVREVWEQGWKNLGQVYFNTVLCNDHATFELLIVTNQIT